MATSTRGFVSLLRYESHKFVHSEGALLLVAVVAKLGRRCPRGSNRCSAGRYLGRSFVGAGAKHLALFCWLCD